MERIKSGRRPATRSIVGTSLLSLARGLCALAFAWCATPAWADFTVAYTSYTEERPALVYNSVENEYLAAWIDVNFGPGPSLVIQRLDATTGLKLGPPVTVLEPELIPYAPSWKPTLAYSPADNAYVVAVNAYYGAGDYENFLLLGVFNGTNLAEVETEVLFVGSDFYDDWGNGSMIGLVYNELDDEFFITYQRKVPNGGAADHVISTQRYAIGTGVLGTETNLINFGLNGISSHDIAHSTFITEWHPPSPPVMGSIYLLGLNGGDISELGLYLVDPSGAAAQNIPFTSGISGRATTPSITTGRVAGMSHDYWLVSWADTNNACFKDGTQLIEGCEEGTTWSGVYGSFIDPWRFNYGPGPDNITFPISMLPQYSTFSDVDATYNAQDSAFHVAWRAIPIDNPLNGESRSHIRMNTVDSFITSYPAPWPYPNHVVSDITCPCPASPAPCQSDQDPVFPAIVANGGSGAMVVWEQQYPPNQVDHDIFGDMVQPVPEPGQLAMLVPGLGLLHAIARQRQRRVGRLAAASPQSLGASVT